MAIEEEWLPSSQMSNVVPSGLQLREEHSDIHTGIHVVSAYAEYHFANIWA